jgi:hypothetical protein
MRLNRPAIATAALAVLATAGVTAATAPASAAAAPTPQAVCGSAYKTVNSAAVGSRGRVYLTYNATNGKNCVATIRNAPAAKTDMTAWVYVPDTDQGAQDNGMYTSFAGPASVYGKGHCVNWGGNIGNVYVQVTGSNCARLKEHVVTSVR